MLKKTQNWTTPENKTSQTSGTRIILYPQPQKITAPSTDIKYKEKEENTYTLISTFTS